MNILASYQWIQEYVKTTLSPEEFAKEFSLRSMSVETIDRLADRFHGMIVGVVTAVDPHPNADRLRVATVDCGNASSTIVCGGTNLTVGMKVLVAPTGTKVRWHGAAEWTVLEKASIRGVESDGMICAPEEVGLDAVKIGEKEIWDLTAITDAPAGTPIADALGLNDAIFDCEITTNRPDAMGMLGLAREAAAAVSAEFVDHEPKALTVGGAEKISVRVDDRRCERYMAAVVTGVRVEPSPWWLQKKLILAGHKPINTIVDISNYVLLELGQPLHAFDAEKIHGNQIVVRKGKKGESLELLDGKTVQIDSSHIVIADADRALALAGIMGGKESGTTTGTTTVVFEAAVFDALAIRKGARAVDVTSDAQLLYEKKLSPGALPRALARAVELAEQIAGGTCEQVIDIYPKPRKPAVFPFRPKKVSARIGMTIDDTTQVSMLERLGFAVEKRGAAYRVTVPYWREEDIEAEVDFTEEIARMYGYHNMPPVLPASRLPDGNDDASLVWELWTKHAMAERGFVECFSNSLVSVSDLESYGISPKDALCVLNPLTEDLTHLRTTLIPSMLRTVERNQALTPSANIFEVARVYIPREGELPDERLSLVVGSYGVENAEKTFMELRGLLDWFAKRTGLAFTFDRLADDSHWHAGRTASVHVDGGRVGTIGQVSEDFQTAFGVHRPVFFAVIDLEALIPSMKISHGYTPLPVFPAVRRDVAVLFDEHTPFQKIHDIVRGSGALVTACDVVDVYRGDGVPEGKKSVTLSVTFMSPDRTLTSEEVAACLTTVTRELALRVDGIVRE